ncbi:MULTISPECIES: carbohydrate ABC transporter permease [Microbacterium]|uniref:ABC transporter permease n=1 Tax=Microbacterium barkeri TaxID=33917 RepID=A0A9W6H1V5_9MICO|nr:MULTISPECIES: sugar ABC transporter permease [Microbacterium]MDI6943020.1 sugar ABC transporter permease [Microbacterium barkeri]MDR6876557.1 multiple sugar transport system permease protein [Microbacterium barkeri]WRH17012.1 ABC transporter permease subunit [Microbacterium sp. JZ37]GLJ61022.1 ABC transporter permease [Microbacterium barkeri]
MTTTLTRTVVTADSGGRRSRAGAPPLRPGLKKKSLRETLAGYAFLAPWLVGFLGLTLGPMVYSLYLSFTSYNLFTDPKWIGLENYVRMFTDDPQFVQSATITLVYVLVGTPIKLAAALGIALLLNYRDRGAAFFRSSFYAPSLIGASVSVAIVWRAMFNTDGPVDSTLSIFGIDLGGWVGNVDLVVPMMILLAVWQFGGTMVIFLAGLKQVPKELYEAAEMDGAGALRRFRAVTVPMLSPVIFFNLLLELIGAFQVFASAYIISNGTGGPAGMTNYITIYLYKRGFTDGQFGYASAIAWIVMLVVAVIAVILFRTQKSWVHYAGEDR